MITLRTVPFLAERAEDGEVKRALKRMEEKRMEEAWRTLAQEQEQLDNKRWSKKSRPCEAADFYHPTRPSTAGFHVGTTAGRDVRRLDGRAIDGEVL